MSRRENFEDDGRTVADMSGLESPGLFGRRSDFSQAGRKHSDHNEKERNPWEDAALSIAFVFLAGIAFIIWLITLYT